MDSRFSRQEVIIGDGQQQLADSTVVIVGCGALGTVQAELLARSGVGKLILIDFDLVEESNLQRQALYKEKHVGKRKVDACEEELQAIWSELVVEVVSSYLSLQNIAVLGQGDVVLDGTDNMNTRFLMNEYCKQHNIPAVYASAVLDRGSVLVVPNKDAACYNCVFGDKNSDEDCGTSGVYTAATHLAGTVSAHETLKLLLGQQPLQGLFSFSLTDNRYDVFTVKKKDDCKVCNETYDKLNSKDAFSIRFCNRVGGLRADPLNKKATKQVTELQGQHVIVGDHGEVFFPGLKDADKAKKLAEELT